MFSDPSAIMKLMEMQKQQQQDQANGMGPKPLQAQAASTAAPGFSQYAANIPQVGGPAKTDKGPLGALQGMVGNIPIAGQASQALMGVNDAASGILGGILQAPLKGMRAASQMFQSPTMALRNRYL